MQGPAVNRGGAGAPAPLPTAFELLDMSLIHKGNLLARARFAMPSGLIITANVLRSTKDVGKIFVLPVGERQQGGGFTQIVDFASPELRDAWQAAALKALDPRWADIVQGPARREAGHGGF